MAEKRKGQKDWDKEEVRALREHLSMTQQQLARELGVRQQTISEWEVGAYEPRGASRTLLSMVAERAGFTYGGAELQEAETEKGRLLDKDKR